MSHRLKFSMVGALAFLLLANGLVVWCYYAPHRAVTRLHQALRTADTNALIREIDFSSFQASLQQQITMTVTNKMAHDSPDQKVSPVAATIAGGVVKYLVAEYASPAGLARLLTGAKPGRQGQPATPPDPAALDRAFDTAVRQYRSTAQFVVYLTGDRGETSELILERTGLRWQLRRIVLPPDER